MEKMRTGTDQFSNVSEKYGWHCTLKKLQKNYRKYPKIVSLSNAMNWPEGAAISFYTQTSPWTYAVYPWSLHCECAMKQKQATDF